MKKIMVDKLKKAKKVLITMHQNPDPDALCSVLVMGIVLKQWGIKYIIVSHDEVLERYHFLPTVRSIKTFKESMKADFDCVVICDCGDLSRIGKVQQLITKTSQIINIDHHITNDNFGLINEVNPKASSTVEVLYDLLFAASVTFTKNMAMLLYTGIVADTGSFRYDNTGFRTHQIAAELMQFGFSASKVYQRLYETISLNDASKFMKIVNRYESHFRGKVLSVVLRKSMLKKFSGGMDLRDSIFKFLITIVGVEAIVIFTENDKDKTRVNLRATGKVDVAALAHKYNGGGHKKASGCMVENDLLKAKGVMLKELRKVV